MNEHSADHDALRREYNAAVANGLILRARRIERRMNALDTRIAVREGEA